MFLRLRFCLVVLLVVAAPATAAAQQPGTTGVTMGYPALGVIWHASDSVALRPELSFSRFSNDRDGGTGSDDASWSFGTGISALFYISKQDNLRTYVSPRYSYSRSSTTSTIVISGSGGNIDNKLTTSISSLTGSFGAQYAFSPRFSGYGELGLSYGWQSGRSSFTNFRADARNWGTRTGVGVILYF